MKTRFTLISALAVVLLSAPASIAQNPHAGNGAHEVDAGQPQAIGGMDRMTDMMRRMMPMMERMQNATSAERERMMKEMRPMMQSMMSMMQGMMGGHGIGAAPGLDHQGQGQPSTAATPSTRAFEEANLRMHRAMAIAFTGDADVDFTRSMIAHHQGAIDMARVVLEHGRDGWVKKLADEVITAQTREIADMREWLARNAR